MKTIFKSLAVFAVLIFFSACEAKKSVNASASNGGGGVFAGFSINAW
ncbi:MAG: hypothetical protein IJ211_04680 [Campylobacter sp.]|nr:hypothetical protein [Campylobacter sp.]